MIRELGPSELVAYSAICEAFGQVNLQEVGTLELKKSWSHLPGMSNAEFVWRLPLVLVDTLYSRRGRPFDSELDSILSFLDVECVDLDLGGAMKSLPEDERLSDQTIAYQEERSRICRAFAIQRFSSLNQKQSCAIMRWLEAAMEWEDFKHSQEELASAYAYWANRCGGALR